jgi:hypothetical protein
MSMMLCRANPIVETEAEDSASETEMTGECCGNAVERWVTLAPISQKQCPCLLIALLSLPAYRRGCQ